MHQPYFLYFKYGIYDFAARVEFILAAYYAYCADRCDFVKYIGNAEKLGSVS